MNAVATGEHPVAWAPDTWTFGSWSSRPTRCSSWKPLVDLGEQRATRDRHHHVVGRLPPELLRGLVRRASSSPRRRTVGRSRSRTPTGTRPRARRRAGSRRRSCRRWPRRSPPYTAVVRILPASRSDGTNTKLPSPVRAAAAATAFARLPVDAHAAVLKPNSSALPSATATTRSLKELVGLRVSSLIHTSPRPSSAARRSARISGVHPAFTAFPAGASTGSSGP